MGTAKICGAAYSTFSSRLWSTGDKNGFNEAEIPNQSYGFIGDSFIVLSLHAAACVAACQGSDFIHSDQVKVMLDGMFHTRGSHRVFYGILRGVPGDQSVDQPSAKAVTAADAVYDMDKYYTDASTHCTNREVGARCGFVVTMRVGVPVPEFEAPDRFELLRLIDASPKPVTLVIQVDEPEAMHLSDSNFGGQYGRVCNICGVQNVICDGAVRDVEELEGYGI